MGSRPISVAEIAQHAKQEVHYRTFYRAFSQGTHASLGLLLNAVENRSGKVPQYANAMIDHARIPAILNNASGCIIEGLAAMDAYFEALTKKEHGELRKLSKQFATIGDEGEE